MKLVQEHQYELSREAQRERILKRIRHQYDDAAESLTVKPHSLVSSVMKHDSGQA